MRKFSEFAKISRQHIISSIGVKENSKYIEYETIIDFNLCPDSCKFKNKSKDGFIGKLCNKYCNIPRVVVEKKVYDNEKNSLKIKNTNKLSRTQILQYFLYHFVCNSRGIIIRFSVKETAELLNISEKTVVNNIKALSEKQYIAYTKLSSDLYNIYIINYENYHKTSSEGGKGYIYFSKKQFFELVKIKSINELRLVIRAFYKTEEVIRKFGEEKEVIFSHNYIKLVLPKYMRFPKKFVPLIDSLQNFFEVNKYENKITFKLLNEYNINRQMEIKYIEHKKIFINYFINISNFDYEYLSNHQMIDNLVRLSFEYNIFEVKNLLDKIIQKVIKGEIFIHNLVAYLRTLLETHESKEECA